MTTIYTIDGGGIVGTDLKHTQLGILLTTLLGTVLIDYTHITAIQGG